MYIFVRAWSSASRSTVRAHLYVLALLDVPTSIAQIAESLRIFGLHSQDLPWSVLLADGHGIVLTSHQEGSLATIWSPYGFLGWLYIEVFVDVAGPELQIGLTSPDFWRWP